jgi:hypothetical protein
MTTKLPAGCVVMILEALAVTCSQASQALTFVIRT